MAARLPIHSIGHSTLAIADFLDRLAAADIGCVIDVRALPGSQRYPQFDQDALRETLAGHRIDYVHCRNLGGRRGRQPGIAEAVNGAWDNPSFHHYADWALLAPFAAALAAVRERSQHQRCAIMCAESLWWRCHRRIIADHLLAAGEDVRHIMTTSIQPARLHPAARIDGAGRLTYPRQPGPI